MSAENLKGCCPHTLQGNHRRIGVVDHSTKTLGGGSQDPIPLKSVSAGKAHIREAGSGEIPESVARGLIILDLCGGSGAWSKPYSAAGYDVRVITLPHNDVRQYSPPATVHGILAAPPCTMFSLARQRAKTPRNLHAAMEIVEACLKIIWACRLEGTLKFWAIENPAHGYLRQFIGKPAFTFQPAEFGAHYTKRTCLWGYFKQPVKTHRYIPGKYPLLVDIKKSAAARSITPPGFANSFYKTNQ